MSEHIFLLYTLMQKMIINKTFEVKMENSIDMRWKIKHGMYITGTKTPYDFLKSIERHNMSSFVNRITQNVLLLAGKNDQYVPVERAVQVQKELVNVSSIALRIYTEAEGGAQHCQVGNPAIVLEEIYKFLEQFN
ncbi:MAG: hypothetical protein APF77_03995 [Clostridia bacterium BRH_c25]|nr:MAG: hypothetical protein APF77_03995 [Clostridia bacterium BRH_c25]